MVSIIKNKLLKHLSRFTKNLSADRINLSTFKGEGDLTELQLDENVLTDLLELPSWLRLTRAWCNKVSFRIQLTKLKSVPIVLTLDEVHISVETCEDLRPLSASYGMPPDGSSPTKYSFIDKVIDGMTVYVNAVFVNFRSPAFVASVQMSRIAVSSKTPSWKECPNLNRGRVKDPDRGEILIFKELEWQTVRIEAQSTNIDSNVDKGSTLSPLRLLTNTARCRLIIKKRLCDKMVKSSRLVLILDDLLWVLTDAQLRAALTFLHSLADLVQKATELTRKAKAERKLKDLPEHVAQVSQSQRPKEHKTNPISIMFDKHDVIETSYHFLSERIDLHLVDDPGGRSSHPDLRDGGALQIELRHFLVDFYPYHLARSERKHWVKYREGVHTQWLEQSMSSFRTTFLDLVDVGVSTSSSQLPSPWNNPRGKVEEEGRERSDKGSQGRPPSQGTSASSEHSLGTKKPGTSKTPSGNAVKNHVLNQLSKLMTTCIILRIENFTLYRVTTSKKKTKPREFIAAIRKRKHRKTGDKERYLLPKEDNIVHAEFTYYYYPGDLPYPLPPPKFFVQMFPIQVNFDINSILWVNSFALNLIQSLSSLSDEIPPAPYIDIKIEAIHPRLILESRTEHLSQRDRPKALHFQTSRALITNMRSPELGSLADLSICLNAFQEGRLFFGGSTFPSQNSDFQVVIDKFLSHLNGKDHLREAPRLPGNSIPETDKKVSREMLWIEAKDVWYITCEPVWAEFHGASAVGGKTVPLFDAFPLRVWAYLRPPTETPSSHDPRVADIHVLAHISALVSVQLNHYQYLFLLRISDDIREALSYLSLDSDTIATKQKLSGKPVLKGSLVVGAILPQVEVSLVMPSQTPGREEDDSDAGSSVVTGEGRVALPPLPIEPQLEHNLDVRHDSIPASDSASPLSEDPGPELHWATDFPEVVGPRANGDAAGPSRDWVDVKNRQSIDRKQLPLGPNSNPGANVSSGFNFMRKGLTNLVTSFDSAFTIRPTTGTEDSSDTVSMRSDASSEDSEMYAFVNLEVQESSADAIFRVYARTAPSVPIPPVEMASEVTEEDAEETSSSTNHSLRSLCKRKDLPQSRTTRNRAILSPKGNKTCRNIVHNVSMTTFKLRKVEFIQQSEGFVSSMKIQVGSIVSEECGSIPWDEFQQAKKKSKFASRSKAWSGVPEPEENEDLKAGPCTCLRLDHSPAPGVDLKTALLSSNSTSIVDDLFSNFLEVRVHGLSLALCTSTLSGMAELVEDEIYPKPLPMKARIDDVHLHLKEDRPSGNITSPGPPPPMDVAISHLLITRDLSGVFCIQPMREFASEVGAFSISQSPVPAQSVETQTNAEIDLLLERQRSRELRARYEELQERLIALTKEKDVALSRLAAVSEENIRLHRALQREGSVGSSSSRVPSLSKVSIRESHSRVDDEEDEEECREDGR
ncbi:UHRF1-binding protein 1 isoform X3 [Ischnura elegans]|uniref:UHRF1-binding protein 1 isoform X3 n=1 Tax=Ischnura elegans TaxID=197161 RepID=UPI001ED8BC23|nr:UHRF1-binding protein 1 isoform X3 [Ischnura elegans]